MTYETLKCSHETFVEKYWPPLRERSRFEEIISELKNDGVLVHIPEGDVWRFKWCPNTPSDARRRYDQRKRRGERVPANPPDEKTLFDGIGDFGLAILTVLKRLGIKVNSSRIASCPDTHLDSEIWGANFRIDSCTTKVDFKVKDGRLILGEGKRLHVTDILVPMEFKISRKDQRSNRLQIASAANHIMNDDVRRMFILGITIEDSQLYPRNVTLTFFAAPILNSLQEPYRFVELLVALFCASDKDLGLDPHIELFGEPGSKKYLYELPPNATRPESQYFLTEAIVDEYRSHRIAGRSTRVWKVVQVTSKEDLTPIPGAKPVILKDAWINEDADTEEDIQEKLFRDIDTFVAGDWRSNPLLKHFPEPALEAFGEVVKNYRDYFSPIAQGHSGKASKSVVSDANPVPRDFFLEPEKMENQKSNSSSRTGSVNPSVSHPSGSRSSTLTVPTATVSGSMHSAASNREPPRRKFTSKRRCFFIYQYLCQRISDLPTLADALEVLRQAHLALMLMFCARWIHRDISHGNILAFQNADGSWRVKVSDLEYAKMFPPPDGYQAGTDPKTGTPFFMAYELQKGLSLYSPASSGEPPPIGTRSPSGSREYPVIHNYQHDVESLWWMALWLVMMRTDHQDSYYIGLRIFQGSLTPSPEREMYVLKGLPEGLRQQLHPSARCLFDLLQEWLTLMFLAYQRRSPAQLSDPESYAYGCATPIQLFAHLKEHIPALATIELKDPSWMEGTDIPDAEASKPRRVQPPRRSTRLADKSRSGSQSGAGSRSAGSRSADRVTAGSRSGGTRSADRASAGSGSADRVTTRSRSAGSSSADRATTGSSRSAEQNSSRHRSANPRSTGSRSNTRIHSIPEE
ncbi:other/FunK1 protein kinase [Coprinopsis cinerea okayama7|uniref:Other/FunK1 protein kinase n=1 Tax=Coprinopsis cinerea (strain Okayama-7 / 130 / ATCC MYA-4618 / FGSC 9003) TaxID=240176 RepID=A8PBB9_COPC7|nr:other/FunK1 protein kinase [Coprinopsis cinerea okayama7\|eukprot:XP_001840145.2 other/FunK1 protein kinase [Coprinopsis cinerea okayama7\